jgi:16S rRNA (adenine(1408)-N(1))-methyltransferase
VVDLGTGDGRFVLHHAGQDPAALVIGIDADAASMVEGSRKAARGNLPNALFLVAAVEDLPHELDGLADDVRVHFPWASLLRGIVTVDEAIMEPIVRLCAPGASVTVLLSVVERDHIVAPLDPEALSAGFSCLGLRPVEVREASSTEIAASRSSWAKRLRAGLRRPVTLLRFARDPGRSGAC